MPYPACMLSPRFLSSLQSIDATDWDALHDQRNPFISHAFLAGLEAHGCLREDWGWQPQHFTLWEDDTLVAAIPGYLKHNSHGEFVFDHAWANAYAQHGRDYYPKWLGAVPYSPVTGPRLLAVRETARSALLPALVNALPQLGVSSAHVNFHLPQEDGVFGGPWLLREDIQFQWHNPGDWQTFEDFLAAMDHKRRKNIRQERARISRQAIQFRVVHGDEASAADLEAMYRFYLQTFLEYGNAPALTAGFLRHLADRLGRGLVMFLAEHEGAPIAGALCLRGGSTLYGRYWGGTALPGLHFEACYYQGIDYCLREGLCHFEPGAQGEHKLARGFLPTRVRSRHWIADADFARALAPWCAQERREIDRYEAVLNTHSPFRGEGGAA